MSVQYTYTTSSSSCVTPYSISIKSYNWISWEDEKLVTYIRVNQVSPTHNISRLFADSKSLTSSKEDMMDLALRNPMESIPLLPYSVSERHVSLRVIRGGCTRWRVLPFITRAVSSWLVVRDIPSPLGRCPTWTGIAAPPALTGACPGEAASGGWSWVCRQSAALCSCRARAVSCSGLGGPSLKNRTPHSASVGLRCGCLQKYTGDLSDLFLGNGILEVSPSNPGI